MANNLLVNQDLMNQVDQDTEDTLQKKLRKKKQASLGPDSPDLDDDADPAEDSATEQQNTTATPTLGGDSGSTDNPSLHEQVSQNKQKLDQASSMIGKLATNPEEKPDPAQLMQALDGLRNIQLPPTQDNTDLMEKLQQAKQEARDLYSQNANRNAWVSLAQTIGNSMVDIAAANEGLKKGVDLSHVTGKGQFDAEKANQMAYDRYKDQVSQALTDYSLSDSDRQKKLKQAEFEYNAQLRNQQDQFGVSKDIYNQQYQTYREGSRDTTNFNRALLRDQIQANKETDKDKRQETRESDKSLQEQIKTGQDQLNAANSLAAAYTKYDDLPKKEQARVDTMAIQLAGKANVDSSKIDDIRERSKEGTGVGGFFQSEDPKKKSQLFEQEILAPLRQHLDDLRAKRTSLGTSSQQPGQPTQSTPAQAQQAPTAPAAGQVGRVRVKSPTGQVGSIPQDQLQQALQQGYVQVQ